VRDIRSSYSGLKLVCDGPCMYVVVHNVNCFAADEQKVSLLVDASNNDHLSQILFSLSIVLQQKVSLSAIKSVTSHYKNYR
jgi:hypothetical protein